MMELTASKALRGEVTVPGDKSISHRSVMFGCLLYTSPSPRD